MSQSVADNVSAAPPKRPGVTQLPRSPSKRNKRRDSANLSVSLRTMPLGRRIMVSPCTEAVRDRSEPRSSERSTNSSIESSANSNVYGRIRKLFESTSVPMSGVIGRRIERTAIAKFLQDCLSSNRGDAMYISGPAGTGKTSLVSEVLAASAMPGSCKMINTNCMSFHSPSHALDRLSELLGLQSASRDFSIQRIKKEFASLSARSNVLSHVVVLDEMDHLVRLNSDLALSLFECASLPRSKLVFIGLANALDLTDRFLHDLKRINVKPRLLSFPAYTAQELQQILTTKLRSINEDGRTGRVQRETDTPFMHPNAIQLCARKVATTGGDMRKASEIIRRIAYEKDMVERARNDIAMPLALSNTSGSMPAEYAVPALDSSPSNLAPKSSRSLRPLIDIADVSRMFGTLQSTKLEERLLSLSLHQRLILLSFLLLRKSNKELSTSHDDHSNTALHTASPLSAIIQVYKKLCYEQEGLQPVSNTEMLDIMTSLETSGYIRRTGPMLNSSDARSKSKAKSMHEWEFSTELSMKQFTGCFSDSAGSILRAIYQRNGLDTNA